MHLVADAAKYGVSEALSGGRAAAAAAAAAKTPREIRDGGLAAKCAAPAAAAARAAHQPSDLYWSACHYRFVFLNKAEGCHLCRHRCRGRFFFVVRDEVCRRKRMLRCIRQGMKRVLYALLLLPLQMRLLPTRCLLLILLLVVLLQIPGLLRLLVSE